MPDEPANLDSARPADRPDIPALTGLRFVAAFSVLIAHGVGEILASHETPYGVIYWVRQASGFGMTLFFVLSGFVIHYNYAQLVTAAGAKGAGCFLWARFARLYPLLLLMMVVYVLVSRRHSDFWNGHPERMNSILQALPYFLLSAQSWFYVIIDGNPLLDAIGGTSPITWSISTEWFFYFVYLALVCLILRSRTPLITLLVIVLWCFIWAEIASGLFRAGTSVNGWGVARFGSIADINEHQQQSFLRWLQYFSPYLRLGEFVLGSLMAQLYVQLRSKKISMQENALGTAAFVAGAVSAVGITYMEYSPNVGMTVLREMNMNFALAPSAALLIFSAARYRFVPIRTLTCRPVLALGEASYSIYLLHMVILMAAARLFAPTGHGLLYGVTELLVLIIAILLISIALYAYYEAPARRILRGLWSYRRPAAPATPASG
jgi:peptidoglycan/LPS O-acetylase OafA/YrhL